jgi:hypothetical protein
MIKKMLLTVYPLLTFFYLSIFIFDLRSIFPEEGILSVLNTRVGIGYILLISFMFFLLGLLIHIKERKTLINNKILLLIFSVVSLIVIFASTYSVTKFFETPISYRQVVDFSQNINAKSIKITFIDNSEELIYFKRNGGIEYTTQISIGDKSVSDKPFVSKVRIKTSFLTKILLYFNIYEI